MREYCGPDDIIDGKHTDVKDAKRLYADVWDKYIKVTIIRNPWDMATSYYYWSMKNKAMGPDEPVERLFFNPMIFARGLDFHLRFEYLQSYFGAFLQVLDLPVKELPRLNSGSRPHYHDFFKDYPKDRVAIGRIAKEYCETFKYSY